MKNVCFVFFLIASLQGRAQCILSFSKPTISGSKFRITLEMSSGIPFSLGPNNLRFNYPTENLDNPVIIGDNFPADILEKPLYWAAIDKQVSSLSIQPIIGKRVREHYPSPRQRKTWLPLNLIF